MLQKYKVPAWMILVHVRNNPIKAFNLIFLKYDKKIKIITDNNLLS